MDKCCWRHHQEQLHQEQLVDTPRLGNALALVREVANSRGLTYCSATRIRTGRTNGDNVSASVRRPPVG